MGSNLDDFLLRETIKRTINSSPLVQNANILEKKESAPNGGEESASVTTVDSIGDLGMHEGMSREEIAATQNCIQYEVMLRKGGLSREEKAGLEEGFEKAKQVLLAIRQERYDSEGKPFSENVIRANKVIKKIKTYYYIADEKKRSERLKFLYYGIDDPFYDGFEEIYGEEGLDGYRKERPEAFRNISDEDVGKASKRYTKINNILTCIKTIVQIVATLYIFWCILYPLYPLDPWNSSRVANLFHLGVDVAGAYILTELIKYPEAKRTSDNFEIFAARRRIGQELGLLDKDLTLDNLEKSEYE